MVWKKKKKLLRDEDKFFYQRIPISIYFVIYMYIVIYMYKRIDNLCTIFDDSSILLFVLSRSIFFFIALNQTLPMFTKSICNKNISVILSLHEFHYERNRGEW